MHAAYIIQRPSVIMTTAHARIRMADMTSDAICRRHDELNAARVSKSLMDVKLDIYGFNVLLLSLQL